MKVLIIQVAAFAFLISFPVTESCQVQLCSNEYSSLVTGHRELQKLQLRDIKPRITDRLEYCNLLDAYNHCLKSLARSCRGKLDYHAVLALVRRWIDENSCPRNDLPGSNHRSRQSIRSGSFVSNFPPQNHQDNDEPIQESDLREEDGSNEDSPQLRNPELPELKRRGKSSSHHPQCILYAPSTSSSSSGRHQNNYTVSFISYLSFTVVIISKSMYR